MLQIVDTDSLEFFVCLEPKTRLTFRYMQKKAIIFSTAYFPMVGGAEVAMREVTDRLPDWKFDLYCAKINPDLSPTEQIGNVTVHRCGFGHPIDKYLLPITGTLSAFFSKDTSDSIIWSLLASYGGFAALSYTWLRPSAKMLLTLQEGDPLEHYDKRTGALGFLHRAIFKRADAVQSISNFLGKWAKDMGFKGEPKIIPNGVDVTRFAERITPEKRKQLRQEFGLSEADIVIVTASRLSLKNAVDDIIRSLAFLPKEYKALIAGVGEDQDMLNKLVEEKGLKDRVIFLGKRGHDELPGILQASEIFCRPSLSEGLGNSFLEAMSAGIPIIGTPVGGIPDFLTDGETGVFCQPRDPESLAKAARRIMEAPGLREKLIRQGEPLVREKYNWTVISKDVGEMLNSLST